MRSLEVEHSPPSSISNGCIALWRAVIYRALCDACYQVFEESQLEKQISLGTRYISREAQILAQQARHFLLSDQTRFEAVCQLAGIDSGWLRRRAHKATSDVDLRLKVVSPPLRHERLKAFV